MRENERFVERIRESLKDWKDYEPEWEESCWKRFWEWAKGRGKARPRSKMIGWTYVVGSAEVMDEV